MGTVHIQTRPVEEDLVDSSVVLLAGTLALAADLEPAGIQQRVLTRIVPDRLDGLHRLMAIDKEDGIPHRIKTLSVPGRDTELGFDAYDLLNRHGLLFDG